MTGKKEIKLLSDTSRGRYNWSSINPFQIRSRHDSKGNFSSQLTLFHLINPSIEAPFDISIVFVSVDCQISEIKGSKQLTTPAYLSFNSSSFIKNTCAKIIFVHRPPPDLSPTNAVHKIVADHNMYSNFSITQVCMYLCIYLCWLV